MELSIEPSAALTSGIRIAAGTNHYFEIGYDAAKHIFYADRSKSGNTGFNENFKKMLRYEKQVVLQQKKLNLHIYFDNSIVEIFINDGQAAFTSQLFPEPNDNGIELFSTGEKTSFSNIKFWKMSSAWTQK
jgi:sucrose-6-phosphate hydrolase SacC (GH32 family)